MASPRQENYREFFDLCQSQISGNEWMAQYPGQVDLKQAAQILRPLALRYKRVSELSDDEVLATFFSDQALALLANQRNQHCFWLLVQECAKHIGDDQYNIVLPTVVTALEARPDIPRSLGA